MGSLWEAEITVQGPPTERKEERELSNWLDVELQ